MKKFSYNIFLFTCLLALFFETYLRINHLTIDIPRRTIAANGTQKYISNQNGYWVGGNYQWEINKYGWPGAAPESLSNLVTLVGDSHIENFMNPTECQMSYLLTKQETKYNYFQAGRSGVTLIEAMEIARNLESELHPVKQIIFIKESDFEESIISYGRKSDVTQIDLKTQKILNGKIKSPFGKLILYNFKTLYYLRNKLMEFSKNTSATESKKRDQKSKIASYIELINHIKHNYDCDKILFAFHPETPEDITHLFTERYLNIHKFRTNEPDRWRNSKDDRDHWSCYGFEEAAKQLINYLN